MYLALKRNTVLSERRFLLSEGLRAACRQSMVDIVNRLLDNGNDVNENHTVDGYILSTITSYPGCMEWPGRDSASSA